MSSAIKIKKNVSVNLAYLQQALQQKQTTSQEQTQVILAAMANNETEKNKVFTRCYEQWAVDLAMLSDQVRKTSLVRSAIEGMVISVKDLFDVAGEPTTAGSVVLKSAPPAKQHAKVVQDLLGAGAVIIGKTNMTEFAYSGLGINPHYGTPVNPAFVDEARIPGGSSSGAAVSVARGWSHAAVGSDTGGSIRIPAALCGLTGFKPTACRVSREGVLPLSEALDSIGVIAHDVASCVMVDGVIADSPLTLKKKDLHYAHFAVPKTIVLDDVDEHVKASFDAAVATLRAAGATVDYIDVEPFAQLANINAKGGFNAAEAWTWHADLLAEKENEYDPRVSSRIHKGENMLASDFIHLVNARKTWQAEVESLIAGYDALLMPTVPMIAPRITDLAEDDAYFAANGKILRNPTFINFLDGCAISVPCQASGTAPVGLMIAGGHLKDQSVAEWALAIESCLK